MTEMNYSILRVKVLGNHANKYLFEDLKGNLYFSSVELLSNAPNYTSKINSLNALNLSNCCTLNNIKLLKLKVGGISIYPKSSFRYKQMRSTKINILYDVGSITDELSGHQIDMDAMDDILAKMNNVQTSLFNYKYPMLISFPLRELNLLKKKITDKDELTKMYNDVIVNFCKNIATDATKSRSIDILFGADYSYSASYRKIRTKLESILDNNNILLDKIKEKV